jgi:hypothetical protein
MRFEPSGLTNDEDIRVAKSIVDYIFRWMGKKFLSAEQQEEAGILSPEVKARMAAAYANGGSRRRRESDGEPDQFVRGGRLPPILPGRRSYEQARTRRMWSAFIRRLSAVSALSFLPDCART